MKVIHVVWGLKFGGIETMLVNIANEQVKAGADVCVMIINDYWDDALMQSFDERVKLLLVHRKLGSRTPWFMVRMNRMLFREHGDVVHLHDSAIYSLIFKHVSREVCCTLHALPHGVVRREEGIYKFLPILNIITKVGGNVQNIDRIPHVFAISQAVHDELLKQYGVESHVIDNGIQTEKFRRRGFRKASDPFRIVMVSRLEYKKKGQDLLIRAAANLQGRVLVDLIGEGNDLAYLKKLTEEFHAEHYVRFLGAKVYDEIKESLAEYDLLVQPSYIEGFGLTTVEAMAAGVPVLVSSGQGPAEIICGDMYGWTFENGKVDDLTCKIEQIVDNYDKALEKATAARDYVINTYDVSVTADKYLKEYEGWECGHFLGDP